MAKFSKAFLGTLLATSGWFQNKTQSLIRLGGRHELTVVDPLVRCYLRTRVSNHIALFMHKIKFGIKSRIIVLTRFSRFLRLSRLYFKVTVYLNKLLPLIWVHSFRVCKQLIVWFDRATKAYGGLVRLSLTKYRISVFDFKKYV